MRHEHKSKQTESQMKLVAVRVPPAKLEALERAAKSDRRSLSFVLRDAIDLYLSSNGDAA